MIQTITSKIMSLNAFSKNEMIIISILSVTSIFAIKVEMLIAENEIIELTSQSQSNLLVQHNIENTNQLMRIPHVDINYSSNNLSFIEEIVQISISENAYEKEDILTNQI